MKEIVWPLLAAVLTVFFIFIMTVLLKSWGMVGDTGSTLLGISALVAGFFFIFRFILDN